jgi:ferredoxin-NADP reductase
MKATVAEKREVAKGTLFVRFAVADYPDYRPGAYFWVELPNRGHEDEKGLRRHISLATSPTESGVVGLATRLRDSAFKRTLAELEVGDKVQVEEPKGSFLLPEDMSKEYVFVAGGIGITVFRSMLRFIADRSLPYRVTLVYSNRDRESTAFLDELEEIEGRVEGTEGDPDDDRRAGLGRRDAPARRRRARRTRGRAGREDLPRRRPAADGRRGRRFPPGRGCPGGAAARGRVLRLLSASLNRPGQL